MFSGGWVVCSVDGFTCVSVNSKTLLMQGFNFILKTGDGAYTQKRRRASRVPLPPRGASVCTSRLDALRSAPASCDRDKVRQLDSDRQTTPPGSPANAGEWITLNAADVIEPHNIARNHLERMNYISVSYSAPSSIITVSLCTVSASNPEFAPLKTAI